ncbi:hypothetical protein I4U23_021660 [Adineta vaga]|nr:hypothetical protein I4U23_021660 [Adineta vaga]
MESSSFICQVCGGLAKRNNCHYMSCISCKSFFRRYALLPRNIVHCQYDWNCRVTPTTRMKCSACRLMKCFAIGMNMNLIRFNNYRQVLITNHQRFTMRHEDPILFNSINQNSILTFEQWQTLSKIIQIYDEMNPIHHIKLLFENQNIFSKYSINNETFITLSMNYRRILFKRNCSSIAILHGFVAIYQVNMRNDDEVFRATIIQLYGSAYVTRMKSIYRKLDENLIFVKLMIFVSNFSINLSIVTVDNREDMNSVKSSSIQNIYITILWKYMVYQCSYLEAVRRYDRMIKIMLDILHNNEKLYKNHAYQWMMNIMGKDDEYQYYFCIVLFCIVYNKV